MSQDPETVREVVEAEEFTAMRQQVAQAHDALVRVMIQERFNGVWWVRKPEPPAPLSAVRVYAAGFDDSPEKVAERLKRLEEFGKTSGGEEA